MTRPLFKQTITTLTPDSVSKGLVLLENKLSQRYTKSNPPIILTDIPEAGLASYIVTTTIVVTG